MDTTAAQTSDSAIKGMRPFHQPRDERVRAAFFAALRSSALPLVRTAFFAAALRLAAGRFFAAAFACFDSAPRDTVDLGSFFRAFLRACDLRADFFSAAAPSAAPPLLRLRDWPSL
jgi:hypothetical protein